MAHSIGLIVNPIAGMGGSVGLKGTDGDAYARARQLGARPVTPARTHDFLEAIRQKDELDFVAAPGDMGLEHLQAAGIKARTAGAVKGPTSRQDTIGIARAMLDQGAELLVFAGGDGTARDMAEAVELKVPVIGIPSGVKIFSPAFALSARAAADMLTAFVQGAATKEEEVLDIDEDAFRDNRLSARLYGYLRVPDVPQSLQGGKQASSTGGSAQANKDEVAAAVLDMLEPGVLYFVGPGTTMQALAGKLGIQGALLGVDAVADGQLVKADVNEADMLALCGQYLERRIIVTPLGGNGFLFGRGSKQFTPELLSRVGRDNVIVAGERNKIAPLDCLHVDTGDARVDDALAGPMKIVVGGGEEMMLEVRA